MKTHTDPCCCKYGCQCRITAGRCKVCSVKLAALHTWSIWSLDSEHVQARRTLISDDERSERFLGRVDASDGDNAIRVYRAGETCQECLDGGSQCLACMRAGDCPDSRLV